MRPIMLALLLLLLLAPAPADADTGEASIRPQLELRYGPTPRPNPRTGGLSIDDPAFAYGGGALFGLGLDFAWTATLRYGFDTTDTLLRTAADRPETRDAWTADRHAVLAGIAWTWSDEFTPLLLLEAGVAYTRLHSISDRRGGQTDDQSVGEVVPEQSHTAALARVTLGYEWRFSDFWSLTAAVAGEYADGLGVSAGLWLGAYRYTQWY